jgi:pyruvate,water dikinase
MILKGIAASKGLVEGKVKIYAIGNTYANQDILVAKSTSPEMCIEMLDAGAVITENGGMLSHAAIFCREIKKTCVVGVKNALIDLKDGDTVSVNGDTGEIEIK